MYQPFAFAIGTATRNAQLDVIECFFAEPMMNLSADAARAITDTCPAGTSELSPEQARLLANTLQLPMTALLAESDKPLTAVRLDEDTAIQSTAEAYLKLHLLSHRLAMPNSLNLDGIFAHLPNVAWTNLGPIDASEINQRLVQARRDGLQLEVQAVDKFPRLTDYVVPSGVRIADSRRIRLGAYLGDGTTVMHEGFVNFNAGAVGPNMVEGRISQGVILGADSDLGGSSSTMGTLSGGGEIKVSIGRQCLIGANAGTGIPLGDRCTIEAGLYITAGTVVSVVDETGKAVSKVKARELAGHSDMLFIRNSQNGQVICRTNRKAIALNTELHAHN